MAHPVVDVVVVDSEGLELCLEVFSDGVSPEVVASVVGVLE